MEPDYLGLNSSFATYWLCDFGQVTKPLCVSGSLSVKKKKKTIIVPTL